MPLEYCAPHRLHQIVDKARELLRLALDHSGGPCDFGVGNPAPFDDRHRVRDRREWISQFMGKHCQKLILAPASSARLRSSMSTDTLT